ncbi:MAG: DUF2207 domain-containing protein [Mycobacteriales bacterium]
MGNSGPDRRRLFIRIGVVAGIVVLALALAGIVSAVKGGGGGSERITSYTSDITVERSGGLVVTETIGYDFGSNRKHGIYRYLPERLRFDRDRDRTYKVSFGPGPTMDRAPVQGQTESKKHQLVLRLGDPNTKIGGAHTYRISYEVQGAVDSQTQGPELYWNVVGLGWGVPVDNVRVRVHNESGNIPSVACYAGSAKSADRCTSATTSDNTATYSQKSLQKHQGMTIVATTPGTQVDAYSLVTRDDASYLLAYRPWVWGLAGGVLLLGVLGMSGVVYARGRDRTYVGQVPGLSPASGQRIADEARPVGTSPEGPVEFTPPKGVAPGTIGPVIRQSTATRDVVATIVDLAVRGYLRIEQQGRDDWTLHRLRDPDSLADYELRLYNGLFTGRTEVSLSDLHNSFASTTASVQDWIWREVLQRGWYVADPRRVTSMWRGIGLCVMVLGAILGLALAFSIHMGVVGIGVIGIGIAVIVGASWMPARSAEGSAAYARALGFRRYINVAEAAQIKEEERAGVFCRYLPYAVAFGVADRWVKEFQSVGAITPGIVGAYYVPYGFAMGAGGGMDDFGASLDGFSSNLSSTLTSTPASSGGSGFGGGGFSGGGGGGGGGGSW